MKNIKFLITLVFAGVFVFSACQKNEPIIFSEDSHAAFEVTTQTVQVTDEISSVEVSVMLVGPHENRAFNVDYIVIPEGSIGTNDHETNVTEGVEVGTLNKTVSIPANSSFGTFNIEFNHNNIEAGKQYKLLLELQEGELKVSPAYNSKFVLIFFK